MTICSVRYHNEAVQENYNAAESIMLLVQDKYNMLKNIEYAQIKMFRKRFVGLILATDMAKHMEDIKSFKAMCEARGVN